ncbi:hypothetical protein [Hymenobacter terricola]|uniref:hypothetical protein n=1 Tax=Hymenobacter terricola TaxID=2819236 RepID=UPI001B31051B|nr:hypothetical protein [Hymenobacter terricola]
MYAHGSELARGGGQRPFPPRRHQDQVLAHRQALPLAEDRARHAWFVRHWDGAGCWALARPLDPATGPNPRRDVVRTATYEARGDLVGLPKTTPAAADC